MDRLSSCYFCGGALDASLSEYPVVPKELQSADSDSRTVVLCSTCRRKLGAVIEEVAAATRDDGSAPDASTTASSTDTAASTDDADEADPLPDEWESPARDDQSDETAAGESDDPGETSDLRTPSEGEPADSEETATDLNEETDSEATADSGTDGQAVDDATDGPTMTKLEYNKVMRLLQNREFPVDKAEIREVATSAYGIDPDEFDAVVEAAVSRDLIAEEGGQFVAPE